MSLIQVSDLTFAYEGSYDNIFEHASFSFDTSWRLGFTGRNGRGKTTFLRLLCGAYPYRGTISASVDFEYFPRTVRDPAQSTLEVLETLCGAPAWRLLRELNLLELDEDALYRPFFTLSNGEQARALLAALFLGENRYPLIDEPTNHLDMQGRALVSRYLQTKRGFLLVSHDRAFLDGCVDHILSINRTSIEVCSGDFSTWWENRERQEQFERTQNERLRQDIRRLEAAAQQSGRWAGRVEQSKGNAAHDAAPNHRSYAAEQSRRMQQRRKNLERRRGRAIEEASQLLKNVETAEELKLTQAAYRRERLLSLREVSIRYGAAPVCSGVSFTVEAGERVALCGPNGCGKTSLLRLILGEDVPHAGTIERGGGLTISYVPQDTSALRGSLTDFARRAQINETQLKTILRKLDFSRVQLEKDLSALSAGQRKKVLLARSLCERAHLLLWDEPMNYVDVVSRIQLETLLLEYRPTILFVEHDRAFCEKIATKTVPLR